MTNRKEHLPHTSANLFLTDGGLETTLIFLQGFDLPCFAAFDLLKDENGRDTIKDYYRRYLKIAAEFNTGFILESPTWRANPDWMEKVGYPTSATAGINKQAIELLVSLQEEFAGRLPAIIISGCVGPRGDGYKADNKMTAEEAQQYHAEQIKAFAETPVDMVSAITMNYVEEAIGITRAANAVNLPVVISFTVETDGKLPAGTSLKEAIEQVDKSADRPPAYYMINCAHPSHFIAELQGGLNQPWTKRIRGLRANASCKSHAELDEATELDRGNPQELGHDHKQLKETFTHLNVFGGCCGTDDEHVLQIARQVNPS